MNGCSVQEIGLVLDGCELHCLLRSTGDVALHYADPVLGRGGKEGGSEGRRERKEERVSLTLWNSSASSPGCM